MAFELIQNEANMDGPRRHNVWMVATHLDWLAETEASAAAFPTAYFQGRVADIRSDCIEVFNDAVRNGFICC